MECISGGAKVRHIRNMWDAAFEIRNHLLMSEHYDRQLRKPTSANLLALRVIQRRNWTICWDVASFWILPTSLSKVTCLVSMETRNCFIRSSDSFICPSNIWILRRCPWIAVTCPGVTFSSLASMLKRGEVAESMGLFWVPLLDAPTLSWCSVQRQSFVVRDGRRSFSSWSKWNAT